MVSQNIAIDGVLGAFPVRKHTELNWQTLLNSLYQNFVPDIKIFWTEADGGKWIQLSQSLFLYEEVSFQHSDDLTSIREFLVEIGIHVVHIPLILMDTIKHYIGNSLSTLGPSNLREYLRTFSSHLICRSFETKMSLLSYALSDEKYQDMKDIQLLPLDDGNFEVFSYKEKNIFIDSAEHPRSLLMPGFTGHFLNPKVPDTIKKHFHQYLIRPSKFLNKKYVVSTKCSKILSELIVQKPFLLINEKLSKPRSLYMSKTFLPSVLFEQ